MTPQLHWEKNVGWMSPSSPAPEVASFVASARPLTKAEPLLLASGSPRRREILANLGIPTLVAAVDIDESVLADEDPAAYLVRVVGAKLTAASASFAQGPGRPSPGGRGDTLQGISMPRAAGVVLVADTSVIDHGAILGKPSSKEEAESMIDRLQGRTHEVWTRFALGAPRSAVLALHEETVVTRVTFRSLAPARVRAYVATGEGRDKAGGYAIQGCGAGLVARIEGSYSNVVGLPACEVVVALERLGLLP